MCGCYYRRSDKQRIAEAFHLGQLPEGFCAASVELQRCAHNPPAGHPPQSGHRRARTRLDALGPSRSSQKASTSTKTSPRSTLGPPLCLRDRRGASPSIAIAVSFPPTVFTNGRCPAKPSHPPTTHLPRPRRQRQGPAACSTYRCSQPS